MHRGQRLADQPFAARYPGLLTLGIDDPATYIYRGIVADCLRGAEFLLSRPEVDTSRVGIAGDDLALITAARRPQFSAVQVVRPDVLPADGGARSAATPTRSRRSTTTCAPTPSRRTPLRARSPTSTRATTPPASRRPPCSAAAARAVKPIGRRRSRATVEQYELTHEGGTDHDWMDAWMAQQLGSAPKPRLWQVA